MTTLPPSKYQYATIDVAKHEKYHDDEVATVMTTVDADVYYPVKQSHTTMKRRKGTPRRSCCCICGCITLTIFACFFLLILLLAIVQFAWIVKGVRMVTVDTPIDFPIVTLSQIELLQVSNDIGTFVQSVLNDDGTTTTNIKDLVLSARMVNGAISQSDYLRGHAQVILKENEFIFQTSLPMDMLPGGAHRFFVSTMDTTISTGSAVTTTSFDLGKKLSDEYDGPLYMTQLLWYLANTTGTTDPEWDINVLSMKWLGQEIMTPEMLADPVNILQSVKDDPKIKNDPNSVLLFQFINGIDSIRMEPDQIIIRARRHHSVVQEGDDDTSIMMKSDDDLDLAAESDDMTDNIIYSHTFTFDHTASETDDESGGKKFLRH